MNSAVIACLASLLVLYAQGQRDKSSNCKCLNGYIIGKNIRKFIKGEPVIHPPSTFCPNTEIIVTTKADQEKCVNPESPFGKLILKNHNRHGNNGAVSTTTASSQTNTRSSTTLQTKSKM